MGPRSVTDLNKLKVTELREALEAKGLPADGLKAQLVERLAAAEAGEPDDASAASETASSETHHASAASSAASAAASHHAAAPASAAASSTTAASASVSSADADKLRAEREARAARFGIPVVEPKAKSAPNPKRGSGAPRAGGAAGAAAADAGAQQQHVKKFVAPEELRTAELIAARQAKFGVVEVQKPVFKNNRLSGGKGAKGGKGSKAAGTVKKLEGGPEGVKKGNNRNRNRNNKA